MIATVLISFADDATTATLESQIATVVGLRNGTYVSSGLVGDKWQATYEFEDSVDGAGTRDYALAQPMWGSNTGIDGIGIAYRRS